MKNLLIGSRALNYWYPQHVVKPSTDWDVISDREIEGTEWHKPDFLNNFRMEEFSDDKHIINFNGNLLHVVSPSGLALIKRSHLWRDLGFDKHITMFHQYLSTHHQESQVTLPRYNYFLHERIIKTEHEFPQQGPNLKQGTRVFFNDAVTRKYDHDSLHELFAYEDAPMYTKLQKDSTQVTCYVELWNKLSHEQKLQCVAEEVMVTATERFLVPNDWNYDIKRAYFNSLRKVCTTMCKGWFRSFAIDNYPSVL